MLQKHPVLGGKQVQPEAHPGVKEAAYCGKATMVCDSKELALLLIPGSLNNGVSGGMSETVHPFIAAKEPCAYLEGDFRQLMDVRCHVSGPVCVQNRW